MALVDVKLELGARTETVTVSAEAINNITLESQAIARGLDEQQLRDLPRSSRDIQSFLLLNPNVLGGTDDIQFLGGRTYGVSYIQDGQASTNAIFGTVGNSAPGLDAISELQVLSNSYSAEYGGLAGVVVTTKRGGNHYRGTAFYDFNADEPERPHLQPEARRAPSGATPTATPTSTAGGRASAVRSRAARRSSSRTTRARTSKAIFGGGRATVPTEAMRNGDFRGTAISPRDPLTGQPFPDQVIPADRIDPAARNIMDFFYPLPNQGADSPAATASSSSSCPRPATATAPTSASTTRPRTNDSIFLRGSYQYRDPQHDHLRGRQRPHQPAAS